MPFGSNHDYSFLNNRYSAASFPRLYMRPQLESVGNDAPLVCAPAGVEAAIRTLLHHIGEDPEREGLQKTPARYAKALEFFTKGYSESIQEVVNDAIFYVDNNDLVIVRDIDISSMCEHHILPFTGKVSSSLMHSWWSSSMMYIYEISD
jgi:hypothetical protein